MNSLKPLTRLMGPMAKRVVGADADVAFGAVRYFLASEPLLPAGV
jgi:hypothetical protein